MSEKNGGGADENGSQEWPNSDWWIC
jgi:hypothetical protein